MAHGALAHAPHAGSLWLFKRMYNHSWRNFPPPRLLLGAHEIIIDNVTLYFGFNNTSIAIIPNRIGGGCTWNYVLECQAEVLSRSNPRHQLFRLPARLLACLLACLLSSRPSARQPTRLPTRLPTTRLLRKLQRHHHSRRCGSVRVCLMMRCTVAAPSLHRRCTVAEPPPQHSRDHAVLSLTNSSVYSFQ